MSDFFLFYIINECFNNFIYKTIVLLFLKWYFIKNLSNWEILSQDIFARAFRLLLRGFRKFLCIKVIHKIAGISSEELQVRYFYHFHSHQKETNQRWLDLNTQKCTRTAMRKKSHEKPLEFHLHSVQGHCKLCQPNRIFA